METMVDAIVGTVVDLIEGIMDAMEGIMVDAIVGTVVDLIEGIMDATLVDAIVGKFVGAIFGDFDGGALEVEMVGDGDNDCTTG